MTLLRSLFAVIMAACGLTGASLQVTPLASTVTTGSSFEVRIEMLNLGNQVAPSLGAYDLTLQYLSSVLALTQVDFGDAALGSQLDVVGLGSFQLSTLNAGSVNLFEVSFDTPADLNNLQPGSFTIARLTFQALAEGASGLALTVNSLSDAAGTALSSVQVDSGSVEVVPEPGSLWLVGGILVLAAARSWKKAGVLAVVLAAMAHAGQKGVATVNGNFPRPFYIFAHNVNLKEDIATALDAGANALEPDVMYFDNLNSGNCNTGAGPSRLFMHHDPDCTVFETPIITLEDYLVEVRRLVVSGKNVALIAFDVKPQVTYTPAHFRSLIAAVKQYLNYGGVDIPILFNVGTRDEADVFFRMAPGYYLTERMGIMIDGEYSTDNITRLAFDKLLSIYQTYQPAGPVNIGFGSGAVDLNATQLGLTANDVFPNLDQAVYFRSSANQLSLTARYSIPYAYTVSSTAMMDQFIRSGVDGIIPNYPVLPGWTSSTATLVQNLKSLVTASPDVYVADATDNPFQRTVDAYAIGIRTSSAANAGTDANLTFTLTGTCGTSAMTINTAYAGRMEAGMTNHVTIPSKNLGTLLALDIRNDGTGNAPGWIPVEVEVSSAKWAVQPTVVGLSATSIGGAGEPNTVRIGLQSYNVGDPVCGLPSVTTSQTPPASPSGWTNSSSATWNMNWTSPNGITQTLSNCPSAASIYGSPDGLVQTRTFNCQDNAGKSLTNTWTFKADTAAPVATPVITPPLSAAGWAKQFPISVSIPWVDPNGSNGSGISSDPTKCRMTQSIGASSLNFVDFTYNCQDNAGNIGTTGWTLKWDTTLPAVTCPAADSTWRKSYTANCSMTDNLSGLLAPLGATNVVIQPNGLSGTFSKTRNGAPEVESPSETLPVSVCDKADNCVSTTITGVRLDNKAPLIQLSGPRPQIYVRGMDTLMLMYSASDMGSGYRASATVAQMNGTVMSGVSGFPGQIVNLNTLPLGTNTFQLTVEDVLANSASQSVQFTVRIKGDLDGDNDVDRNDLALLTPDLNKPVAASAIGQIGDLNRDGRIDALDARILTTLCTRTGCTVN